MGNDVPGPVVEGSTPTSAAPQPDMKPSRWRPSKRTIMIAAIVLGVLLLGVLVWVVVDQVTRVSVPAAEGETLADATTALEDAGFVVEVDSESSFCRSEGPTQELCVVSSQSPDAGERVHPDTVTLEAVPAEVDVPVMEGMTFDEARAAAGEVGLTAVPFDGADAQVEGHEDWPVLGQSELGTATAGSSVKVRLERPLVDAPAVVGVSLATAIDALNEAGFTPTFGYNPGADPHSTWVVISSEPAVTDGKLPLASKVKLIWGVQVPDVVGMGDSAAAGALTDAGLKPRGTVSSTRKVASQTPAAGTVVTPESEVVVTLEEPSTVYEVVGNGSRASITWIAPGSFDISQAANEPLPWRKSFPSSSGYRNFNAQMMSGTSITCNIYVNGQLVKTNTSTGQYAVVSCG